MEHKLCFTLAKVLLLSQISLTTILGTNTDPNYDSQVVKDFIFSSSRKIWLDSEPSSSSSSSSSSPSSPSLSSISNSDHQWQPRHHLFHRRGYRHPKRTKVRKFYYLPEDRAYDPYAHHPGPPPPVYYDHDDDDLEKSFIHYIFPTILVVGLGSLIIPIIAVFFIAFTYSNNSGGCLRNKKQPKQIGDNIKPYLIDQVLNLLGTLERAISTAGETFQMQEIHSRPKSGRELSKT